MSADQAEHGHQVSEREARQVAEEAREAGWTPRSFGKQLFLGDFRLGLIHPHPRPSEESSRRGEEFCARLREFCETSVDAEGTPTTPGARRTLTPSTRGRTQDTQI